MKNFILRVSTSTLTVYGQTNERAMGIKRSQYKNTNCTNAKKAQRIEINDSNQYSNTKIMESISVNTIHKILSKTIAHALKTNAEIAHGKNTPSSHTQKRVELI